MWSSYCLCFLYCEYYMFCMYCLHCMFWIVCTACITRNVYVLYVFLWSVLLLVRIAETLRSTQGDGFWALVCVVGFQWLCERREIDRCFWFSNASSSYASPLLSINLWAHHTAPSRWDISRFLPVPVRPFWILFPNLPGSNVSLQIWIHAFVLKRRTHRQARSTPTF